MDSMLQDLRCVLGAVWLIGKRRSFGPGDPPTFVGVVPILALSSAAAAWLPTARCEWTPSWRCAMSNRRA